MEIRKENNYCINRFDESKIDYQIIHLKNITGLEISLASFGAGIISIKVPNKDLISTEVTLCMNDPNMFYFIPHGKTIGRTAGRIRNATFTLDGRVANLEKNNFEIDNLHGGRNNLSKKVFDYQIVEKELYCDVIFSYLSPDLEGGYFGDVLIKVIYRIFENKNSFQIIYQGESEITNLLNLTNHTYFNLSGNPFTSINNHILYLNASVYGELDNRLIVKEKKEVNQIFDFRNPHNLGDYIETTSLKEQTNGYDHPLFLDENGLENLAASLYSKESKIKMEIRTTYPCIILYASGKPKKSFIINGVDYSLLSSCCLECQFHPDGIHQETNRNGVFDKDHSYCELIQYDFKIEE